MVIVQSTCICAACRHQGYYACHWCWDKSKYRVNRQVYAEFKRYLPPGYPGRGARTRTAPRQRTHDETVRIGRKCDRHERDGGVNAKHPRHKTGITRWCPLAILPFFNLIRDILPDMMHIIKGVFDGHFIPLFKGNRSLSVPVFKSKLPTSKNGPANETPAGFGKRKAAYQAKVCSCSRFYMHEFTL